ncbi:DUF1330 domain-containing protein [Sphingobium amiense]|uniref:DUF1330 domain-containing protein n=1 Tax=Sphingobium amiense TaxID=135719 RepID=UPI0008361F24|nr:DUF1330 domain-containing protein [Sphingobium amiense]
MAAFVVFYSTPIDEAKLAEYSAKALATVADHGGSPVILGPLHPLHDGTPYQRGAIFSFPDRAAAIDWHESEAYRSLAELRGEAMQCSIHIVG